MTRFTCLLAFGVMATFAVIPATPAHAAKLLVGADFSANNPSGGDVQAGFQDVNDHALPGGGISGGGVTLDFAINYTPYAPNTDRVFTSVTSTLSQIIPDGTQIGSLQRDYAFGIASGGGMTIAIAGLNDGREYVMESWYADVSAPTGGGSSIVQLVEFSTDGGGSWTTVQTNANPRDLDSFPEGVHTAIYSTGQDWRYRITENNPNNQFRVNGFAIAEIVPTPAALPAGLALVGLIAARRRRPTA